MKEKLVNALGFFGYIIWLLLGLIIGVLPFVILDMPWWGIILFVAVFNLPFLNIIAGAGLYIWAFTEALGQKQDAFVIAFYIVFGVLALYFVFSVLPPFFKRNT